MPKHVGYHSTIQTVLNTYSSGFELSYAEGNAD